VDKKMYMTRDEYLYLLKKVRIRLEDKTLKVGGDDCTIIGMKNTECNVGLCDDSLAEKSFSLFPDEFPERKSLKYFQPHQKCPMDWRPASKAFRSGCFYTCRFFKKGLTDKQTIKELYDKRISEVESGNDPRRKEN